MNLRIFLITLVILLVSVGGMIGVSAYRYYEAIHADDPISPTLAVNEGTATVIRGKKAVDMSRGDTYPLITGDAIETEKSSRASVIWPDRSITRIGENSRIVIEKMNVSDDYKKIEISYDIKRGKVWNTIIRSFLGDSYFEAHLPKNTIVAGVRGTTFEINLDNGYIHAVEHSMHLSDSSGRSLTLLPGESVDSENILIKKGKEWLDTTWSAYNTIADSTYQKARLEEVRNRINTLSGKVGTYNPLDTFTRWILSFFANFRMIHISTWMENGDLEKLKTEGQSTLLNYYSSLGGKGLEKERDRVREVLEKTMNGSPLLRDLRRQSLWDSIDSGKILPSAEMLLGGVPLDDLIATLKDRTGDITTNLKLKLEEWLR